MKGIPRFAPVLVLLLEFLVAHGDPAFSHTTPERVWLAGQYDRTRVVVYFEAVTFTGTFPADAAKIAAPIRGDEEYCVDASLDVWSDI